MFEIGRICVKIAGRDAGLKCVIVDVLDDSFVLIDGQTRRRKCNVKHLEPLKEVIKLKKNDSHSVIVSEFKKLKIDVKETKPKKPGLKPVKHKKKKVAKQEELKSVKKPNVKVVDSKKGLKTSKEDLKPKEKKLDSSEKK